MPPLNQASLLQKATVQPILGFGADAEPELGYAYTLMCRWVDTEQEGGLQAGDSFDATVAVAQAVAVGSVMYKDTARLYQVKEVTNASDIKGREQRWELKLNRYKQAVPSG
jgi:hypothetical protein